MGIREILLTLIFILSFIYALYIILYEDQSIPSKLLEDAIKLSGYKKRLSKEKNINKIINSRLDEKEKKFKLPLMKLKSKIEKKTFNNIDYYILNKNNTSKKIFYLHGGSYFDNPLVFHFIFCDKLAQDLNCEVIFPIYPKTPFHDHNYSQKKVLELYKNIITEDNEVILMGDSAGGGFCISLCYLLNEKNIKLPEKTILLSPWLDVSMTNPKIELLEKKDPQLASIALKRMGELWAKKDSVKDPLVSPLYGNVKILKNISLFVGTKEIILFDCRLFKNKCRKNKVYLNYHEYKNMNHVFVLEPIPESKKAYKEIIKIINK